MNSARRTAALPAVGFPIRRSPDQSLVSGSPKLIAATRVLHRLLSPRHPSCALFSLVIVSSRSRQRKRASAKTKVQLGRNRAVVNRRKAPVTRTTKCLFFSFLRVCNFQRSQNRSQITSWWSRSGSNRRHPACKAGALPAELRPPLWWAWIDLNYRPHAYQACALTN
jgi:hypothetical protein